MYIIYRKDYYKLCFRLGIVWCIISCLPVYYLIVVCNHSWSFFMIFNLFASTTYTLFFLIKIKYVIFVVDDYGTKVIVRQHNKETHELFLRDYFNCFRPRGAIKAACKYADDIDKIREVKDSLASTYNSIMWDISEKEKK